MEENPKLVTHFFTFLFHPTSSGFEEAMMEGPAQPMGAAGGGDIMDLMSPDGAGGFNQFLDDNM